ncbi:TIGR04283 family arsenosugar biosynthesis glycosyltransferase [Roseovarius sp. 2305UL8-3]|uniref:TIGR04283 family arsenosugar biosynthesis glycosyltransferase n=1 Tax=Roseovarius conchicola TaxID=3121636 RepID=UPI0035291E3C
MRAELSVVIPTLNAEAGLPACLASLMEGVEAGLIRELVISDGGSDDATLQIADDVGALMVQGAASRGGQLRRGVAQTQGTWVLVIHSDCTLPQGWSDAVTAQMQTGNPAYFQLRFDARGLAPALVAAWANFRARFLGLPYGDQGLLIAQAEYEAIGGYPDQPLMEDVAIARVLRGRLKRLPLAITTNADKYQRDGWVRRGGRNLTLLIRYLLGADPHKLVRRY